jgi:hypothetical protein
MKILLIDMGKGITEAAILAFDESYRANEIIAFEFNGKVLWAKPDDGNYSKVIERWDRLNSSISDEVAKLRATAEEYGTVTNTIQSLIHGGLMPEGWSLKFDAVKSVHTAICEYRRQLRDLEAANHRQEHCIDELLERLARKNEADEASIPF